MAAAPARRAYLLGTGISHSISTAVHNAGAAHLGLDWRYELLDVEREELPAALDRLRQADCAGANVTMPFKGDAASAADRRSASVERSGAANLLVNEGGELVAGNTDVEGMVALLSRRREQIGSGLTVLLGAGGAAAATLEALSRVPPREVLILARRAEAAAELAALAAERFSLPASGGPIGRECPLPPSAVLVVNATALGMADADPSPVAADSLGPGSLVYDYVYSRRGPTALQRQARAAGAELCDGAAHLLAQALPTFEALTGAAAPAAVMRDAVAEALGAPPCEWSESGT